MPKFIYTASDADGHRISGELDAAGVDQVKARLTREGLRLELVAEAGPEGGTVPVRLSEREVGEWVEHLVALTRAGLPLPSGLRASGQELPPGALRSALIETAERLEAGTALDLAV